jgi:soluble lytic murein transglycosylase-like protein
MGRSKRKPRGKRRARQTGVSRLAGRLWALLATPPVRRALLVFGAYVIALNSVVRHVGHGDAFVLSLRRLPEKTYAVGALGLHSLTHLWSSHDDDPRVLVTAAALAHGVPASLALAIARTESGLRPHCISSTGAMGLMQLMPATALAHGVIDPYDPAQNARGASSFLRELSRRYGRDQVRIAAAYNAGAGRVPRHGSLSGLPPETRGYISRVTGMGVR